MVLQPNLVSGCALIPPFMKVYQISRQSDTAFVFYNNFHTLTKTRKKTETQPIFEGSYLGHDLVEM